MKGRKKRPRLKPLRYFFYRGHLCKKIHISRPNDIVTAWDYATGKTERWVYSDVRKNGEQAFPTRDVAVMVNRSVKTVVRIIQEGKIIPPQKTYGLDEARNTYAWYWCEKDIMGLWEYLSTVHFGRPRNDGHVTPLPLPTASELRAMIRQGTVFYVKQGDEFIPTWRADNI